MTFLASSPLRLVSTSATHAGAVRVLNEDRLLERPDLGLWAVADGMGGHASGEVASTLIVEALGHVSGFSSGYGLLNAVCGSLRDVNAQLLSRAADLQGGVIGATVAVLLIFEDHYACVWAGDSRVYLWRAGELQQLTRDHSLVQALVEAGGLSPARARKHPNANIVTRAVGAAPRLDLALADGKVEAGDIFLVCSDGLTGVLEDREIGLLLADHGAAATGPLLDLALAQGARDNVTLVLVAAEAG